MFYIFVMNSKREVLLSQITVWQGLSPDTCNPVVPINLFKLC